MSNYNQKNTIWYKVPPYDFQINIKNLKNLERNQSLIWQELQEQYQKKLDYIKQKNVDQYFEKTALKLEIQKIYENQCTAAAEDYEKDFIQIQKKEILEQHQKEKANLKEQIDFIDQSIQEIKTQFQKQSTSEKKNCKFLVGSSSDYSFIFVLESLKKNQKSKTYIVYQKFSYNSQVMNLQEISDLQSISSISVKDFNQQENILLAYSFKQNLHFFNAQITQKHFIKNTIFKKRLFECEPDIIQILNFTTLIVTNQTQGKIYIITQESEQALFFGQGVISEIKYYNEYDLLRVLNQSSIVEIKSIIDAPLYDEYKDKEFKSLVYYEVNLPNFYIEYSSFLQKISEDSIAYVNQHNEIKVFNVGEKKDRDFSVPTESNLNIVYFHYFEKLNMAIFCNQDGQTYKIEKFTNLFT